MTTSTEPAHIHYASPESVYFLQEYSEVHTDEDDIQRTLHQPVRIADTIAAFAGDFVPHRLYDVAILQGVVSQFEGSEGRHRSVAKTVLQGYFSELSQEEAIYVSSVMADTPIAEQAIAEVFDTAPFRTLNQKHGGILKPGYTGEVPEEFWRFLAPPPDIKKIAKLGKLTNIETHVKDAAKKIDDLWIPQGSDMDTFMRLVSVEQIEVPELEIIGFDGMAMAARDVTMRTRYERLGNNTILDKATKLHEDARKISVPLMFGLIVGEGNFTLKHVVTDMGREPFVEIGDFDFKDPNGKDATGKFRIKTIGSIADKIERYGEEDAPMDIFATTIIEEDVVSSAEMFASMIEQLSKNKAVIPIPAKSKDKAFYVQGGEEYLNAVAKALSDKGIDLSDVQFEPIDSDGYEVSKITFNLRHGDIMTPSEVQFITKAKRHQARLGSNAHYALKSEDADIELETIESIYDRKSRMTPDPDSPDYLKVNGQSIERGRKLLYRIAA